VAANSYAFDSTPQQGGSTNTTTTSTTAAYSPVQFGFYSSLAIGANLSSTSSLVFNGASTPSTVFAPSYNMGGDYDFELGGVIRPKTNQDLFIVLTTDYQLITATANSKSGYTNPSNYTYNLFNILGVIKIGYYIPQSDFFGYLKGGCGLGLYDFENAAASPTNFDNWLGFAYTYGLGVGYGRLVQGFVEFSDVTETGENSSTFPTEFSATGASKDSFNYLQLLFGVNFESF
jgi:hypothetical protein